MFRVVSFGFVFVFALSTSVALAKSPASSVQASEWDSWPSDILEKQYVRALKQKFGGAQASPEDQVLLNYVDYLRNKDIKAGERFITDWKILVAARKGPIASPALALFEGSPERCWPSGFTARKFCNLGIGSITIRYLPKLVKKKEKPAMELLALYPMLSVTEGADAEAYQSFIKDWANSHRSEVRLKQIRQENAYLKPKALVAN